MKLVTPILALMTALALVLQNGMGRASACSCEAFNASEQYVSQQLDTASAVVIGRITSVRAEGPRGRQTEWLATVEVETQYKGSGARRISFRAGVSNEGCGYEGVREPGRHLLVLHAGQDGVLRTSYCSAFPMDSPRDGLGAQLEGAYLGTLGRLAPPQTIRAGDSGQAWVPWAFAAGVLAAMALGVGAVVRFNRRRTT